MSKTNLINFYSIATLLSSKLIFCIEHEVSFCDRTPFPELCDSIVDPKFDSHESGIKPLIAQDLRHLLAMPQTTFAARAKAAWLYCQELYEDAIRLSTMTMNPTVVRKLLSSALVKHQACQNGFRDSVLSSDLKSLLQNFSKSLVNLLATNKPTGTTTSDHGLIQLAQVATPIQANLVVAQDGSSNFKTITEEIQASETQRIKMDSFVIHAKAGVYKENFVINQSMINLSLIGDGIGSTVITSNKS